MEKLIDPGMLAQLDGLTSSYRRAVERGRSRGADDNEILSTLYAHFMAGMYVSGPEGPPAIVSMLVVALARIVELEERCGS